MNYEDYVKEATSNKNSNEKNQTLAMLAIADRLDRLCKILSRGN